MFKFALIPAVALSLSLPAIGSLAVSSDSSAGDLLLRLVGPIVALAYLALLQLDTVNRQVDRAMARLRRRIAIACNHEYVADHGDGRIACRLTPGVFRAPNFDYKKQEDVVSALSSACGEKQRGQYWFVEGDSGTGKTRTALLLVHRLVRDSKLFELGSRCYLYDFSYSEAIQEELSNQLGSARHQDAVILVDNFQLVNRDLLNKLTKRLVREPGSTEERLVVFLSRKADAWNLSPGRDVRLLSEAKAADRHCRLEGPPSNDVAREVSEFDSEASQLIRRLKAPGCASAAQLHLAQVIARNRELPPEVVDTVHLLTGEAEMARPENVRMLALLTALSMHRGTFSRRSLWRAIRVATREEGSAPQLVEGLRMWKTFRRFQGIGLVPRIYLKATRFIFHEDIARQCIDELHKEPTFRATFLAVGKSRLKRQASGKDALRGWLIAVEIGDQDALEAKFDAALLEGAYRRMAQCLRRAKDRYELSGPALLQLAILLDRIGDFVKSRELFASGLDERLDSSSELVVVLAASRLEARHQHGYEADLQVLLENSDRFAAIVGEYWEVHIAAHFGTFEPDRLFRLAMEARKLIKNDASHWRLYSLARMYFDALRNLYLVGESNAGAFVSIEHQALDDYLREHLPTYKALHILYTKAHLVAHVFLPRLALFGEPVLNGDAAIAGLEPDEVATVDALVTAAQRLYRRASDEFWLYGDREESYLRAENLNVKMIEMGVDLNDLDEPLDQYEDFIVGGARNMLASYPCFYRFRREMLRYYLLLDPDTGDPADADGHLTEAEALLHRIIELDTQIGNTYGLLRAELLAMLLRSVRNAAPFAEVELVALEERMTKHDYGFEQRLIRHLIERGAISPAEMEDIFRFYPFVNQ